MGGENNTEICDYCGSLTRSIQQCYICTYDLCTNDAVTIEVDIDEGQYLGKYLQDIIYCKSCIQRYYPDQELTTLESNIFK